MAHRITHEHVEIIRALFEAQLRQFSEAFTASEDLQPYVKRVRSAAAILLSAEIQLAREELNEAIQAGDAPSIESAAAIYQQRLGVAQMFSELIEENPTLN